MNVNAISFSGKLYLKNPELWTKGMKRAIAENKTIQKKLEHCDVFGEISAKEERKQPKYFSYHHQGDMIYKVDFIARKENATLADRLKGTDNAKKYIINQHYHSEHTTIQRIEQLNMQ